MDEASGLLTLEEAARYLGVSKTSLRRWTNEGRLDCHRVGVRRERRFDIRMLNAFLADGELTAPNPLVSGGDVAQGLGEMTRAGGQRHICLFFRDADEQWKNFRPYFLDHFKAGQPTIYLYDSSTKEDLAARLESEEIDAEQAQSDGLLQIYSSYDSYLKNGNFSAEAMIENMRQFALGLIANGSKRQLLVGEMSWFFKGAAGVEEIHEYESGLNELLAQLPSVTIVCHYDVRRFDAENVLHACCTHPVVQIGDRLQKGFYGSAEGKPGGLIWRV